MPAFLTDLIVPLLVIGIQLTIGIFVVRYVAVHPSKITSFARFSFLIAVLLTLVIMAGAAVIAGHGERVWHGARNGVWGGALFGAWMTTRKQHKEVQLSEALRLGIAEILDGALVGALIGVFVLDAAESWKEASLGAVLGSAGWAVGRLLGVTPSNAPFFSIVRVLVEAWIKMRSSKPQPGRVEVSIVSVMAETLTGAMIGAMSLSLIFAAWFGWGFQSR